MTPNRSRTTMFAAALLAVALTGSHDARAQAVTQTRNGDLGLKNPGNPQGYAFLKQILDHGQAPQVWLDLVPEDQTLLPEDWTWKVSAPGDSGLKGMLSMKWYGQAACPDDLTLLQVTGPAGTLTQNPLVNPVWGYFNTQSFTVDTVKDVCIAWANETNCDPAEPGCVLNETFDLVGGVDPATPADRLVLKASCTSGPVANTPYAPVVRVRCNRGL